MTSYQNFIKDYAKNNNLKYRDAQKIVKEQALFKTEKTSEKKTEKTSEPKNLVKTIKVPKNSVINIYMTQNNTGQTPVHTVSSRDGVEHHDIEFSPKIKIPEPPKLDANYVRPPPLVKKVETEQEKKDRIAREAGANNMNALMEAIAKRKAILDAKGSGYVKKGKNSKICV